MNAAITNSNTELQQHAGVPPAPPEALHQAGAGEAQGQAQEVDAEGAGAYSGLSATYSPDDNKLRLYSVSRLDRTTYDRVKAAGFAGVAPSHRRHRP